MTNGKRIHIGLGLSFRERESPLNMTQNSPENS